MEKIAYGYCHCGCGDKTSLAKQTSKEKGWVKGEPLKFINGHRARLPKKNLRIESICPVCGTLFQYKPSANQKTCSPSCRTKLQWREHPECFDNRDSGWKGKRHSPESIKKMKENFWNGEYRQLRSDGYIVVREPDHPRARFGRVPEQVIIAEKALGRYLKDGELAHHLNENKQDNRNENLLVCDTSYHTWLHMRMKDKSKWN